MCVYILYILNFLFHKANICPIRKMAHKALLFPMYKLLQLYSQFKWRHFKFNFLKSILASSRSPSYVKFLMAFKIILF